MRNWFIQTDGRTHEFDNWKDASVVWDMIKIMEPGDAVFRRGDNILECA